MNLVPVPSDRPSELGPSRQTAPTVQPVEQAASVDGANREDTSRGTQRILDLAQRERLVKDYQDLNATMPRPEGERHSRRALQTYGDIAQGEQREQLADLLGVDLYA